MSLSTQGIFLVKLGVFMPMYYSSSKYYKRDYIVTKKFFPMNDNLFL